MLLYRLLTSLFAVAMLISAARRGGRDLVAARLGFGAVAEGPHIWWHGASNGELASSRALLVAVLAARPDLKVLVTCNSQTGAALVRGWALERVSVRPAPVDLGWVVRRMLRRWQVVAHVTLESELWPHRLLQSRGPVIVLGARMTEKNARVWRRFAPLARRLLEKVALVSPQDAGSAARLVALGLPPAACGPVVDLKAGFIPGAAAPDAALQAAFPRDKTWLAASTHPGDEVVILAAHSAVLRQDPDLRLILVPRHASGGAEIAAMARDAGFAPARRSLNEAPQAPVYIADTMGEMETWYQLAGRVFIGGTLSDRGGHTPFEPAAFGCAVLHGPDTAKHQAGFDRLAAAGAACQIRTAEDLAAALTALAPHQAASGAAARAALAASADAPNLCTAIVALLPDAYKP